MLVSEKNIQEALSKLISQLQSIEKVDGNAIDLLLVQEKVDLAITSISVVQEEQVLIS
jgi:hypothetical protein